LAWLLGFIDLRELLHLKLLRGTKHIQPKTSVKLCQPGD
jgi:hypothetical protein